MKILEQFAEATRVAKLETEIAASRAFTSPAQSRTVFQRFRAVQAGVECPHNPSHVLEYVRDLVTILPRQTPGHLVEAGCFKGGSAAKVSIIAKLLGRDLLLFDSFEGLPENEEVHAQSILGHSIDGWFREGEFCGGEAEVRKNVTQFGEIGVCRTFRGWFDQTMPNFHEPIAAAYIDVDLAESTKTCIKYLYPLISPGGLLYSQDGDFPLVIEVFKDERFWAEEVGCPRPKIDGLGKRKMLRIQKPALT